MYSMTGTLRQVFYDVYSMTGNLTVTLKKLFYGRYSTTGALQQVLYGKCSMIASILSSEFSMALSSTKSI